MSKEKLFNYNPQFVRTTLNEAVDKAEIMFEIEGQLIHILLVIDRNRLFTRYGFKSLLGFCNQGLKLTRTQAQRLVTQVRQHQTLKPNDMTRRTDGKDRDFARTNEQTSFANF